jgi:hypothetical protein
LQVVVVRLVQMEMLVAVLVLEYFVLLLRLQVVVAL